MATEPSSDIVFEDLPSAPRYDWAGIAEKLQAKPMEWAKVFDFDRLSTYEAVRGGSVTALRPAYGFEARSRNSKWTEDPDTGRTVRFCSMWLRYNPANDTRTSTKKGKR